MPLYLSEDDVHQVLTAKDAVQSVEQAFRRQYLGEATNQVRHRITLPRAVLHVLPAALQAEDYIGLKAYAWIPGRTTFVVLLFSLQTGQLDAIIEGDRLGQMRTGAASAVATRHMARGNADEVAVLGSGWQARGQVEALHAERRLAKVRVYSPTPEHRQAFCRHLEEHLHLTAVDAASAREAVAGAGIVITATTARQPVLLGDMLSPGTHINAMGSNWAQRRELDEAAVLRCRTIVVDDLEQAAEECGDLLPLIETGALSWQQVHPLCGVVGGEVVGRRSDDDITLFESHGIGLEDVAVAVHVYRTAVAAGLGQRVPNVS